MSQRKEPKRKAFIALLRLVSFAIGASNFLKNKHHFSKTAGLLDSVLTASWQ
jgi:hypothetical protein